MKKTPLVLLGLAALSLACGGGEVEVTPSPAASTPASVTPATAAPAEPAGDDCASKLATYQGQWMSDAAISPQAVAADFAKSDLRVLRNEIYARYGRAFKSEDLQEHFGEQSWYCVDEGFKDDRLTANDRKNVNLIKGMEKDSSAAILKRGQYVFDDGTGVQIFGEHDCLILASDMDMYGGGSPYGDDMYGGGGSDCKWESWGDDYLITWTGGGDTWKPGTDGGVLWKINIEAGDALESWAL